MAQALLNNNNVGLEGVRSVKVLSFLQRGTIPVKNEPRNDEPKTRSVILPTYVWDALDNDAARCRRSATKQIEAILVRYYDLEANVELDETGLSETAQIVSRVRRAK